MESRKPVRALAESDIGKTALSRVSALGTKIYSLSPSSVELLVKGAGVLKSQLTVDQQSRVDELLRQFKSFDSSIDLLDNTLEHSKTLIEEKTAQATIIITEKKAQATSAITDRTRKVSTTMQKRWKKIAEGITDFKTRTQQLAHLDLIAYDKTLIEQLPPGIGDAVGEVASGIGGAVSTSVDMSHKSMESIEQAWAELLQSFPLQTREVLSAEFLSVSAKDLIFKFPSNAGELITTTRTSVASSLQSTVSHAQTVATTAVSSASALFGQHILPSLPKPVRVMYAMSSLPTTLPGGLIGRAIWADLVQWRQADPNLNSVISPQPDGKFLGHDSLLAVDGVIEPTGSRMSSKKQFKRTQSEGPPLDSVRIAFSSPPPPAPQLKTPPSAQEKLAIPSADMADTFALTTPVVTPTSVCVHERPPIIQTMSQTEAQMQHEIRKPSALASAEIVEQKDIDSPAKKAAPGGAVGGSISSNVLGKKGKRGKKGRKKRPQPVA
jgi:hypothetical protein